MSVALTETDLLAIISKKELDGLTTKLITTGQPDPIAVAIAESLDQIRDYIDPWQIREGFLKRIWRVLAVCSIYNRLATLPEKREKELAAAIKLLEAIRDGKFKNLEADEDLIDEDGGGAWGSETKF